jgi:hypothetical protein
MKMGADPGNLEWEKDKSAESEVRLEAARPAAAERALTIKEHPSEEGGWLGFSSFSTH